nr:reverse transcriptase [Tanacetum cinerariifolium]
MEKSEKRLPQQPPQAHTDHGFRTMGKLTMFAAMVDVVEGNVVGPDLCDNVGTVGLNLSPNRQRLSQSSSAPYRDPGLQLPEVPHVGPTVFTSTCSQLLPQPMAIVDINRPPIRNSEHYGDDIHAPNADTSSNWQSGSGQNESLQPRVVFGLALIFAGLCFIGNLDIYNLNNSLCLANEGVRNNVTKNPSHGPKSTYSGQPGQSTDSAGQASTVGALNDLGPGAWNMDTGHGILPTPVKSLHLNNVLITPYIVKNLIYVRQFVHDNNFTIEFDAFGFSVKDFMTRRVLLRCDNTRDLYPVITPSPIPHAFLTVYMHQPPGFWDSVHPDYVCLLQRSLYGLKQAPRVWFQRFASYITRVGFSHSRSSSESLLQKIIRSLHRYDRSRAHMDNCNPSRTLIDTESKLGSDLVSDPTLYRSLTGCKSGSLLRVIANSVNTMKTANSINTKETVNSVNSAKLLIGLLLRVANSVASSSCTIVLAIVVLFPSSSIFLLNPIK